MGLSLIRDTFLGDVPHLRRSSFFFHFSQRWRANVWSRLRRLELRGGYVHHTFARGDNP
jgi:hypothetical protein